MSQGAHQLLVALAQALAGREHDLASCGAFLADIVRQFPLYTGIVTATANGDLVCSSLPLTKPVNVADRAYFRRVLEKREFVVGEYTISRLSGNAVLTVAYPSLDKSGTVRGLLIAGVDLRWIGQLPAQARWPDASVVLVLDRNGTILARHPDPGSWIGKSALDTPIGKIMLARRQGVAEAPGPGGTPRLWGFTALGAGAGGGDVYLGVGVRREIAFADANRMFAWNLAGFGIVVALAVMAAWGASHVFVLRPVRALIGRGRVRPAGPRL